MLTKLWFRESCVGQLCPWLFNVNKSARFISLLEGETCPRTQWYNSIEWAAGFLSALRFVDVSSALFTDGEMCHCAADMF